MFWGDPILLLSILGLNVFGEDFKRLTTYRILTN